MRRTIAITALYLLFGVSWIVFSDRIAFRMLDQDLERLQEIQNIKGIAFVLISAGLIFSLIRSLYGGVERINREQNTLLANQGVGLLTIDQDRFVTGVSDQVAEFLGYTVPALLGQPLVSLLEHPDQPELEAFLQQQPQPGQANRIQLPLRTANGDLKWVTLSQSFSQSDKQAGKFQLIGVQNIDRQVREIHKNQRLLKQLRERNRFIEAVLNRLPIGIAVHNTETEIPIYLNPEFTHIYGWPEEAITDVDRFFELVYPDETYRQQVKQRVMADISAGDPDSMMWSHLQITTAQGETKIINAKNIPLPDQQLMISTVTDVTELIRSTDENQLIFDHSYDIICVSDFTGNLTRVNPAMVRILGWSEHELKTTNLMDLVHPDDHELTRRTMSRLIEGEPVYGMINRYRTVAGEYRSLSWNNITYQEGQRIFGIARDITDQLERDRHMTQAILGAVEEERQHIADELHDGITQTLSIANINLKNLVYDQPQVANEPKYLKSREHLEAAIQQSRSAAHRLMPKAIVDFGLVPALEELIHECQEAYQLRIRFKKKQLPDYELPQPVVLHLYRIVQEALHNVWKHAHASEVLLTLEDQPDEHILQVRIEDDGKGFDVPSAMEQSKGIGLRTMHNRAEQFNARIYLDSQPGAGTSISLRLPIPAEHEQ